jgi:hypothetical protein
MGEFKGTGYVSPYTAKLTDRGHKVPAAATPSSPEPVPAPKPAVERAAKVERKAERLAQAFVPGASTDQPVLRRGRGAGRRFTKATAVGAAVARAQRLAPERRREIAQAAASTRWGGKRKAVAS